MDADLRKILEACERIPGCKRALAEHVDQIRRLHRGYRVTHWGDGGNDPVRHATVPDVSGGVVVLGELVEIGYLTKKGSSTAIWEHEFDRPYPWLTVAPDGQRQGLVLVRGRSRYTVTSRGIVG